MGLGRRGWMDALRGAAVLLIVVWHVFSISYEQVPAGIDWTMNLLAVYRVPLLLLLSGLLLERSLRKPIGIYATGKLRRIAWPLLVWSAVLALIGFPGANPANPWFWFGDAAHLWYLGVLLACYAIGILTRWVPPWVILIVGYVAMELAHTEIGFVNNTLWFGLFFFVGATLSRFLDLWLRAPWFVPAAFVAASLAWAGYSATVNSVAPIAHWRPLVFSLLGVVGVTWFAAHGPRVRWIEWVGQRSMVFYVAHVPIVWLITLAVPESVPAPVTYALALTSALGGCYLLARTLNGSILFEFPSTRTPARRSGPTTTVKTPGRPSDG